MEWGDGCDLGFDVIVLHVSINTQSVSQVVQYVGALLAVCIATCSAHFNNAMPNALL